MSDIIYGKNGLTNIVSCEVDDGNIELFFEKDGKVTSEIKPFKYWMVSSLPWSKDWVRLAGNQNYKYIYKTTEKRDFYGVSSSLKGKDVWKVSNLKEMAMLMYGFTYFKGLKHNEVSVLSFDIETTSLNHDDSAKLLLISNTYRNSLGNKERKLFAYDDYSDEGEMIADWCSWVREKNPTILTGHNINSFDLPYLNFIANKYDQALDLGRNESAVTFNNYESKFRKDGSQSLHYHKANCYGREIIDTMFLALKYDIAEKKYESYGLKQIVKQEGLEVKDRVFYDASRIRYNYENPVEWSKIKEYCIYDADDALNVYDLTVPAQFYWTQMVPKSFQAVVESATGSQINSMLVRSYLQHGESLPARSEAKEFEGAYSGGIPGIYSNCIKYDVASLYPSIMIQYEVYDKNKDPKGNFLSMIKYLTNERLENKRLAKETGNSYYKNLEQAQKIGINSGYGFLGASGLLFNSPKLAAFVTEKGREILNKAVQWATGNDITVYHKIDEDDAEEI